MLPNFLVEETIVRGSGESSVYNLSEHPNHDHLLVTLGITHAVEQESLGVDILSSKDGKTWTSGPVISFTPKSYCGTYKMIVPVSGTGYLKAVWKAQRWSKTDKRPFFRMYLVAEPQKARTLTAGAA